jgi:hypothetical protein
MACPRQALPTSVMNAAVVGDKPPTSTGSIAPTLRFHAHGVVWV